MRLPDSVTLLQEREPMGIVIADGGPGDRPSRFAAFVWGPVPDDDIMADAVRDADTEELAGAS
jgi:hypothetical protein